MNYGQSGSANVSSKEAILKRLRAAQTPFTDVPPLSERKRMTPLADSSPAALRARFIAEAEKVGVKIWPCADEDAALEQLLALIGSDTRVMAWESAHIPLSGLSRMFEERSIERSALRDTDVRVGITGADAGLATTGSLVLPTGAGKARASSLLPPVHVVVLRESQIVADLEAWFERQRRAGLDTFRASANTVIITGGSRTADIGQELIMGAHGPVEVHVVLIQ